MSGWNRHIAVVFGAISLSGCVSGPTPRAANPAPPETIGLQADGSIRLTDAHYFHQQDPKWARETLGGSNESLASDGCLVTAAAMALANLGFHTNPADLTARLKKNGGFTSRGWLVWSGIDKVTGGRATARFYDNPETTHIENCLRDGFYPLVKFKLASRRSHWAMVVAQTPRGFYIRDPMVNSTVPIPLKARAPAIDAVRCVGVERA